MDAPQQLPQEYTLANVNAYLREECPDEISALPPIDSFVFTNTPVLITNGDADREAFHPICNMQLLLGNSTGEYTTYSPVYLCLGGEGNNRVGLNCNGRLYTFNLDNLSYVNLAKPFIKLLRSQKEVEVLREAEKTRLKAYGCYLFLIVRHIQSINLYSGSKDDMRYASAWLARENDGPVKTARQKAAILRQKEIAAEKKTEALRRSEGTPSSISNAYHETPAHPEIRRATANHSRQDARVSPHGSAIEGAGGCNTPLCRSPT
jgi:hypothetical protein